ncbi:hypothetical protein ABTY59_33770 [Streptomyces sp. NPDC096079]|uniref:hypothetical protein n=1 Tax=Streptomyces sp. NPDC096079 TaxID=3155820 RepID=UPI003327A6C0
MSSAGMTDATARLVFVGGMPPVLLEGVERHTNAGQGYTYLTGWAAPGVRLPAGDLCLARVEWGGEAWAVADANVDVSNAGVPRDHVSVSWRTGWELGPLDAAGDLTDEGLPWLMRARTLRLVDTVELVELVDQIIRYAVAVADGHRDPRWARRLALACAELRSRHALGGRRESARGAAADDPVRLLHEVMAAGGHMATTAGSVRARVGESLGGMPLVTVPRVLPADPAAPVVLVNRLEHTVDVLRAAERVAAEERARLDARVAGADGQCVPAVAGAELDTARVWLLRFYADSTAGVR